MQPIRKDPDGTVRFVPNKIVKFLAAGRLNDLSRMDFPAEDWQQLAQLIGYSISGYGELSYVSDGAYDAAKLEAEALGLIGKQEAPS